MNTLMFVGQMVLVLVMIVYFVTQLKGRGERKAAMDKEARIKTEELTRLRATRLTQPLSERTRPKTLSDMIGQEEGIRALKAALCGPNPQHVLIYGPPGVGKTCAARAVLEYAKSVPESAFSPAAPFVEMDATCVHFDERSIADPLIGSVHDPIYQGSGAFGTMGVPQPKPGAVTKAHGGILFLDEIGELHPTQMNKLLKVLEDRKVLFESAYYARGDENIPAYIHDIFKKGLPADFRLVGATTKSPEEIPPAVRSRCMEIFFRPLHREEIEEIARNAARRGQMAIEQEAAGLIGEYCTNGRDAVNIVQMSCGVAGQEERGTITPSDVRWVLKAGRYQKRPEEKVSRQARTGVATGLAVAGAEGMTLRIEAALLPGSGKLYLGGLAEREGLGAQGREMSRKSTAAVSVQNALAVLKRRCGADFSGQDVYLNIPGGMPVDGPSAGTAVFTALYSAWKSAPIPGDVAMTGEIGITGEVWPVGGVFEKLEAARRAGARTVFLPRENMAPEYEKIGLQIVPVSTVAEILERIWPKAQAGNIA